MSGVGAGLYRLAVIVLLAAILQRMERPLSSVERGAVMIASIVGMMCAVMALMEGR